LYEVGFDRRKRRLFVRRGNVLVIAIAGMVLSPAGLAADGDDDPFSRVDPRVLFQGTIRESDIALVFDYLRFALAAAAEGREAPVPEELQKRAEALGHELRTRGTLAALLMLSALEARTKQLLREGSALPPPRLPPVAPFVPIATD
jgi:hypothetical protein